MLKVLLLPHPLSSLPPVHPSLPELLSYNDSLEVPLDPPAIQSPFKVTPNEGGSKTSSVTYTAWIKEELHIIKDFPKCLKTLGFTKEFSSVIQTYEPGYSNLYQLLHILVSEGHAKECMEKAGCTKFVIIFLSEKLQIKQKLLN